MAWNIKKITVEYLIYLLFWSILLLSPVLGSFIKDVSFFPTFEEMVSFWKFLLPALLLFVLNNNIFMPFLIYKKRGRLFVLYLLCIIVACTIVYISFPLEEPPGIDNVKIPVKREVWGFFVNPRNVQILIAVFVLVFNICIRLFFFTVRRDEHLKELEKEHLRSSLEYLRYQINPHFFMNTLNNIHALIDIDKDKARIAVQEFSTMMRYVLYDTSASSVPLEKEVLFMNGYIDLMRLRYTDKIEIRTSFENDTRGIFVPPMLFMQFVENAFKHGVTYKKKTVIDVALRIDDACEMILFTCRNTVLDNPARLLHPVQGGIGVENARKRLELLFGEMAAMRIYNDGDWYNVENKIPIRYGKVYNSR